MAWQPLPEPLGARTQGASAGTGLQNRPLWASPQVTPAGEPDFEPGLECSYESKDCLKKAQASSVLRGELSGGGGHHPRLTRETSAGQAPLANLQK